MPISGLRKKRRNREGTASLNHIVNLISELRADMATIKEEMNQHIHKCKHMIYKLHSDSTNAKEDMNQRVFAGPAMTDREDLRYLNDQNHEQMQRQLQQMQAQIDNLHAERYSGSLGTDSHTIVTLPFCYRWTRYFGIFLRALAIVGLIIGCGWNLRELLKDMLESPTVTKMTFTLHEKLSLPPISVFHIYDNKSFYTPMLHTEKLFQALENGSLTEAYLEGIKKGVGIGFLFEQNIAVQPSEIAEAYKEAILHYGSLTEAGLALQKEYGISCDDLFIYCGKFLSPPMNCCDIFEYFWGLNGLQYALKRNTIVLDAFRSFNIYLRSLPNIKALQKGDFVLEPGNYQSYWLGIGNGVDQTGLDPHAFEVKPSETVTIMLRQKSRNLKVSKDCIELPPKLRYFRDYTIRNCFTERCILDKFSLCNFSCEVPLLQLLNPDNLTGPPCWFHAINSTCLNTILDNQHLCTKHGCRFPCNHTEVEYSVTKELNSSEPNEISLELCFDTTEVQTFEETSRLTLWEYLSLISSILDLWLGITIFSLHRMLFRGLSKITYFKPCDFGKNNSAASHSASAYQQHEMANISESERDRRTRSSNRSYY